jgi:hypothetical protein
LEHRASNPVSVKNLTAIETSTIVKLLRPYVPVGTKRTRRRKRRSINHISLDLETESSERTSQSSIETAGVALPDNLVPLHYTSVFFSQQHLPIQHS